ncbi:nucleotide sugar dehydrogenase [Microcella sp.]|uniref:nucleotide sugar dehydrogenase n=1 Tax=Microcella sp. TaxID=1913979 RepID=UPI003F731154
MPLVAVIVGQGYVGLPLAQATVSAGIRTIGLDTRDDIVLRLNEGLSHVDDLDDSAIAAMVAGGYRASTDASVVAEADIVVICVPTPLSVLREPDLGAVRSATEAVAPHLKPGSLVVLESTTYPGTTEEVVRPILESAGHSVGQDVLLAYSPERIDPGNQQYTIRTTPKIVGGVDERSTAAAVDFYGRFIDRVVVARGTREAETAKLLENTYRHINIALVNEMARFCHELGVDIWDVISVAETKPFGFQAFRPGPGVGGHCIPIDPNYLSYEIRRRLGEPFRFIELAEEINRGMPAYVVERLRRGLESRGRSLSGAQILLLGVTYKPNISDQRESPALEVGLLLRAAGAEVSFHDPHVEAWRLNGDSVDRVADLDSAASRADAVVLLQAHHEYDVDQIAERSAYLLDTRGISTTAKAERL